MIGDTVNLASRLERANKLYATHIRVSEATREAAGPALAFREIDSLQVAGKREPARVFELLGRSDEVDESTARGAEQFEAGLARYRARDWNGAENRFRACLAVLPEDGPSQVFLGRLEHFRREPLPADWDQVWVAASK